MVMKPKWYSCQDNRCVFFKLLKVALRIRYWWESCSSPNYKCKGPRWSNL